ncbi:MAG: hypothetical protein ACJ746_13160 [Bryobacteraceae bacterium]
MSLASPLTGSIRGLFLYEIAEEVDLDALRKTLKTDPAGRQPAFRHPAPEYVRYEKPSAVENLGSRLISPGINAEARIRYFEYGVASLELRVAFEGDWDQLVNFAHRWISSAELEQSANASLRDCLKRTKSALIKPHDSSLISEDYYIVQIDPIDRGDGCYLTADTVLHECGERIAQIVRGENVRLSAAEAADVIRSSLSYYPTDVLIVGWVAAFIYDKPAEAVPTIDLLEYANSQLLEFRYYDDVLTDVLADVYKRLEQSRSFWRRWTLARQAEALNTIRLDYQELAERTQNAIKFLGDMYYARAYRLAASRIGANDYRELVTEKLNTARDLYDALVNEFHQGRAFFLEVVVVVILIIEIVFLFRGKG